MTKTLRVPDYLGHILKAIERAVILRTWMSLRS